MKGIGSSKSNSYSFTAGVRVSSDVRSDILNTSARLFQWASYDSGGFLYWLLLLGEQLTAGGLLPFGRNNICMPPVHPLPPNLL